jgi:hypothetical protein
VKKFLLGALSLLGLAVMATSASGADLAARPVYKAPPPAIAPVFNWTGFYLGGEVGEKWGQGNWTTTSTSDFPGTIVDASSPRNYDPSGFRAGGYAGFCNGPGLVNPFLRHPLAGHLLLYGIGARPSPDGIHERSRSANLLKRDHIVGCVDNPHGGLT